jgi:hypothetical protein
MEGLFSGLTLLQAAPVVTEVPAATSSTDIWLMGIIALCVVTLPFVLGTLIGNALRMKEISFRLSTVIFATALALTPFIYHCVRG